MKLEDFNPKNFVDKQVEEIRKAVGDERTLIAVSGGVDSTTSAALTHLAIGEKLLCVMLDDAFMRKKEPEKVAQLLSRDPLNLPIQILNVRERFLKALKGLRDAEEKRKAFRETFYKTLSETAKKENCSILVQGTILADVIETKEGVKTQHNVLEQIGISPVKCYGFKVIEPLKSLYKWQVRMVARHLGIPPEISERQPFPGPGLSVRVVGEIRKDKLESLKEATSIVEESLTKHRPSQYFAAIIENVEESHFVGAFHVKEKVSRYLNVPSRYVSVRVLRDRATGVKNGERRYGRVVAVKAKALNSSIYQPDLGRLISLQTEIVTENPSFTRVLYLINETKSKQPYSVIIRAVQTRDFLTAKVADIPWETLTQTANRILDVCANVSNVYYDVTPKPPATIEME